jgi:hypothetical protein
MKVCFIIGSQRLLQYYLVLFLGIKRFRLEGDWPLDELFELGDAVGEFVMAHVHDLL